MLFQTYGKTFGRVPAVSPPRPRKTQPPPRPRHAGGQPVSGHVNWQNGWPTKALAASGSVYMRATTMVLGSIV